MSDYISLEALRAMTGDQLYDRWADAQFPFDMAGCNACVTQHKYYPGCCTHSDLSAQASRLKVALRPRPDELRANLPEIYTLRMWYRNLYPSTPEPSAEAPALETAEIGEKRL
jgi:hypothetical protein